ncbi:MAG: bacteriochlorophyll 4-vinyl reductase [Pseudomonadota bacterium]
MDGANPGFCPLDPQIGQGGKIGPNSVIQLGETVTARLGSDAAWALYCDAGVPDLLNHPPKAMIDERVPAALFASLWDMFPQNAALLAEEAGHRTADYIIAWRIPPVAQILMRFFPRGLAARFLLKAIRQHAWTFAGSGKCDIKPGTPHLISIRDNPLTMPDCAWHSAVLARLFDRLVAKGTRVRHVKEFGASDPVCRFEIALPGA